MGAFTGFVEAFPRFVSDFIFGAETGISSGIRNSAGDWRPDVPNPKNQLMKSSDGKSHGDTECCTDFGGTNNVGTQMDWLKGQGQIDPNAVNFLESNGYLDEKGRLNLSPRFTAVMSGTTPQAGNTLPNVWNSMRHDGLVPESAWPMPTPAFDHLEEANNTATPAYWAEYFAPIPQSVKDLGKQFAQWFDVQYEWVIWPGSGSVSIPELLKVAPLQISTAVCGGWNTDNPIAGCGPGTQHSTNLLHVEADGSKDILDHYQPYMKRFAPNYSITYAMRGVVSVKPQVPQKAVPFTHDYQQNLYLGMGPTPEVLALQRGLQTAVDKDGKPYMKPGVFGPFGAQTQFALGRFQMEHGIVDAPAGHDFGPQTRAVLTQVLKDAAQKASGEPIPRPLSPGSQRPN